MALAQSLAQRNFSHLLISLDVKVSPRDESTLFLYIPTYL